MAIEVTVEELSPVSVTVDCLEIQFTFVDYVVIDGGESVFVDDGSLVWVE
jgi:hypothetical protein